jgi:hypothetical protein
MGFFVSRRRGIMGDDKNKSSLLPISGVLIILAALGVTIFTQPFKGTRPFVPELRESYEKVNARLWQDPFRAVLDSVRDGKQPKSDGEFDISKAQNQQKPNKSESLKSKIGEKKTVTVLGVMVPGAPYAEDTEIRMRLRYATLSGLGRVGFIPDDAEHIGFIQITPSKNITLSSIMPFEWLTYTEDGKEKDSVLVVWINDNVFQKTPLLKLARLAEYLEPPKILKRRDGWFKIIGPATSTPLKEMVREVFDSDISKRLRGLQGTIIYSAIATVDNALLLRDSTSEKLSEDEAREKIVNRFDTCGIAFKRTIESDNKLAKELVHELKLRGVHLKDEKEKLDKDKKPHLVLVAEWDTYYGRSFYDVFIEAAIKEDVLLQEKEREKQRIARRVHRISYLRGIDGSLPGEKENIKDEKAEAKSDPLKDTKSLEQPIGKSQYDYLRRLAEETYRLDQDLQANKKGEIKAIGVMGTDFYDKYLVLQALRQRFPDVIFFTTDLDARFLHPDNIKWTRNLVVASNFGLSLRKDHEVDIQGEVPPFRDNYQTSVFLAVLRAFSDESYLGRTDNDQKVKELIKKDLQPLIFEIGRHQAVVLTDTRGTIHPGTHQVGGSIEFYIQIVAIILSALIFLFFTSTRVNTYAKGLIGDRKRSKIPAVIGALLIVVFAVAIYRISNRPGEEPFFIFEGISVWPTEVFRFTAILLSALFIYWSWRARKENTEYINKEFDFESSQDNGSKNGIWNWIKKVAELDWKPKESKQGVALEELWFEYVRRDQYHFGRVIIIAISYLLFCGLIVTFDVPVSPVRGTITSVIDKILVMVSVISFVALLSYVFDVTRCCRKFITMASNECSRKSNDQPDAPVQVQIDDQLTLIRLIAIRTDRVGKLIFYPFIVWLVMFVSRFDYFDNWRTPLGLALVISLGALYAWGCAFLLRQSAEGARTCALGRLKKLLFDTLKEENPNPERIKQMESVLDEVKSIRQGAFAPFTQHPVVQSLLVPFGGVGGIYLIEFLTKMNI